MAKNNDRKTWKDVWTRLATVESQLDMIIGNTEAIPTMIEQIKVLQKDSNYNKTEHKTFWKTFVSKNSFKIVSIISGILLFIIAIIEVIRII